ncbi:hypothetical protein ACROYT_G015055 [Oculina patagonica]
MIAVVSRELVAAEAWYHRSCYRHYTRPTVTECVEEEEAADSYARIESKAYEMLFDYIRFDLLENPRLVKLTELTDVLLSAMRSFGVSQIKDSTKKHLKRRLEQEFCSVLHFEDLLENNKQFVIPDNISRLQLARETAQVLQNHLSQQGISTSRNRIEEIKKVGLYIRDAIISQDAKMSWPPQPSELAENAVNIPEELEVFLHTVLTGSVNRPEEGYSARVQRLINSFSQDIVFGVSGGRQKPPKQILLPYAVKSLTNNVELIQILNRFGHGVAYSQIEEMNTALCLHKMALTQENEIPLPQNIQPFINTTLAWDNIDRLEETLSGSGTSHRVNGIAVQARHFGPQLPPVAVPEVARTRQKALILRLSQKSLHTMLPVSKDNVGYLPTVDAPATDMATVHEVLVRSLKIKDSLRLQSIVVVFDQALYAKAMEIQWKHSERFKDLVLRMGVFHTACTLLSIVGKRFQDAGLRDLCVESGVIAEGSVSGVLDGRRYNRAVRCHKLMYEALMRLAWKGFQSWVEDNHPDKRRTVDVFFDSLNELYENTCANEFEEKMTSPGFAKFVELFDNYLKYLRLEKGKLSQFWMSYLDLVEILLGLLRACREGNWELHLSSVRQMIPWCFAYDNLNYARYLSAYVSEMSHLEKEHPEISEYFRSGGFSVQVGIQNPFGKIPVDQACEETVNKDTQTAGGTKPETKSTEQVLPNSRISQYIHAAAQRDGSSYPFQCKTHRSAIKQN